MVLVLDGCSPWILDFIREPLPLEASRHGFCAGMLTSSGPAGAGGAPGWRRTGPGPDHRPRRAGQARKAPDPEPRRPDGRPFQRGVLLLALATFVVSWCSGAHGCGPRCLAAPRPRVHGALGGHAVLGRCGTAFSHWRFTWRCRVLGWPAPVPWPGLTPPPSRGSGPGAPPACCPGWRSRFEIAPAADVLVRQNRAPSPGRPGGDRRWSWRRSGSGMRAGRKA